MRLLVNVTGGHSFEAFVEDETDFQRVLRQFADPGARLIGLAVDPITDDGGEPRVRYVNPAQLVTIEPAP